MIKHPQNEDGNFKRLKHIAFIMDGNGRWAKKREMPREYGHSAGANTFKKISEYCFRGGIDTVTVYAFSTENWKRPQKEVDAIMKIFAGYLKIGIGEMTKNNICVRFLGDKSPFKSEHRRVMEELEEKSKNNRYNLNVAVNYGGRAEIVTAVRKLVERNEEISEENISKAIYTHGQPDPDLIVRTGGEMRLSNYLTWQSVYSELYFTDVLWPDLSEADVDTAVENYYSRQRRFGGV